MSFLSVRPSLQGTPKLAMPFKLCSLCKSDQPPEGGIELGPGRWSCASCWTRHTQRRAGGAK